MLRALRSNFLTLSDRLHGTQSRILQVLELPKMSSRSRTSASALRYPCCPKCVSSQVNLAISEEMTRLSPASHLKYSLRRAITEVTSHVRVSPLQKVTFTTPASLQFTGNLNSAFRSSTLRKGQREPRNVAKMLPMLNKRLYCHGIVTGHGPTVVVG